MGKLLQGRGLRDLTEEEDTGVSTNELDKLAYSAGRIKATPDNPRYAMLATQISNAVQAGLVSEGAINAFVSKNPAWAPLVLTASASYKKSAGQERENKKLIGQYINEGSPAIPAQPFVDEQAQAMGLRSPPGLIAEEAVPAVPAREDYKGVVNALAGRGQVDLAEKYQKLGGLDKRSGDNFEGPILFDDKGNTFRATKSGEIVPIPVSGGARIAPPVYPYQYTPEGGGPPMQGVITKPEAARRATGGPVALGLTEAQGKQNIENKTKYSKATAGLSKLENTLGALDKFVSAKGTTPGIGPINAVDKRTAETLHANVLAGLRELDDMGVLQPGELPFLERQVANPGDWRNVGQADAIRAQIKVVRERAKNLKPVIAKQFGQPAEATKTETTLTPAQQRLKALLQR